MRLTRSKLLWMPLLLAALAAPALAERPPAIVDDYYNIGGIHQPVSTGSEEAQTWFDRGLAMCYGFNHEEAVRCFQKALEADPKLALAQWGIAYALGPNQNNMLIAAPQMLEAYEAIGKAKELSAGASPKEQALIEALARRYADPVPEDREPLNQAYAEAMRDVYRAHSGDPLVCVLYAESLINLQPWKHWSPTGEPGEHTGEIVQVLEQALDKWPDHPNLCHFYIHTMEASPTPEKALPFANRLRTAVPGCGHLIHMPTHIDIWTGDYKSVVEANQWAIEVDKEFLKREGPLNFFTLYRIHNYHFLVYGAMFDGQSEVALVAARAIKDQAPEEMIREQVDFLDAFMPTDLHVLVRFGRWEEILEQPEPAEWLPMSRSIWHYARAIAYASTNRVEEAEEERAAFDDSREEVPETSFLFQNASLNILEVAEAMMEGEIAYRKQDYDKAFVHLREAVRLDDQLNYDEPWGWMQPARHALGALLLEQGRFAESEEVYREDLRRHPKNPWALHGLAESLHHQGKPDAAAEISALCKTACQRADVAIDRSCYCRLGETAHAGHTGHVGHEE